MAFDDNERDSTWESIESSRRDVRPSDINFSQVEKEIKATPHSDSQEKTVPADSPENTVKEATIQALPLLTVSCPSCDIRFEQKFVHLELEVNCPHCGCSFAYVDGYLNQFKAIIELFIDRVFPVPLVPGYSTGGEATIPPDDLILIPFGITYRNPPEVFFLLPGDRAARECILENQYILPLSVGTSNLILFSRTIDIGGTKKPTTVTWRAIGEIGEYNKPLWLSYLQNAANLVRDEEDIAAVVMLLIALDFYYDHVLERLGIEYETIRREGRRPGMNEKKAKLKLIREEIGTWPASIDQYLHDLTDYRNRIVHRVVKRPNVQSFSGRRAFQIVMRGILFLIEMYYRKQKDSHETKSSEP